MENFNESNNQDFLKNSDIKLTPNQLVWALFNAGFDLNQLKAFTESSENSSSKEMLDSIVDIQNAYFI